MKPPIDLSFAHAWQAEILASRPLILPPRHLTYPAQAEEVERGALEVLVRPEGGESFLATCALGFRDAAAPTGLWACPNANEICAVSGGYAYVIDTMAPERFTMLAYRPVLGVGVAKAEGLLLFAGHRGILAWGREGQAWESERLSDEGLTIDRIADGTLHGAGWEMRTDKEVPFAVDLRSGRRVGSKR